MSFAMLLLLINQLKGSNPAWTLNVAPIGPPVHCVQQDTVVLKPNPVTAVQYAGCTVRHMYETVKANRGLIRAGFWNAGAASAF